MTSTPAYPRFSFLLLASLLAILALRLTLTETLGPTLSQRLAASAHPDQSFDNPGPAVTLGLASLTLLLAAGAAFVTHLRRFDALALSLIATLAAALAASTLHAENKFAALVGSADLLAAILGGYSISLLSRTPAARKLILATLVAILAAWSARGLVEYFIDYPDNIAYFQSHRNELLANEGITPNTPLAKAFESRLNSREIAGFISLSNVYANALIGLITAAAALLLTTLLDRKPTTPAPTATAQEKKKSNPTKTLEYKSPSTSSPSPEVPLTPILITALALTLAAALLCLLLTGSKGALAATALSLTLLTVAAFRRNWISQHRRKLLFSSLALFLLGAAALIGHGLTHDSLPSKSLLFRWHYWTASAPLIAQHPATGVGLHNFGNYYPALKRPSSPEDVKDPHSFFIRLAAETGLPATTLIATLLLLFTLRLSFPSLSLSSSLSSSSPLPPTGNRTLDTGHFLLTATALTLFWWTAHALLAEPPTTYHLLMTAIYGSIALIAFTLVSLLSSELTARAFAFLPPALFLAAIAMFLYDQINMALVTGPAALLFWTLLTTGSTPNSQFPIPNSPVSPSPIRHSSFVIRHFPAYLLFAAATALFILAYLPTLNGTLDWDPSPAQAQYALHATRAALARQIATMPAPQRPPLKINQHEELQLALTALDAAIHRSPSESSLYRARISLKQELGIPISSDILKILSLDKANASPRIALASLNSDLPPATRAAILEEALALDAQLPKEEAKKLTPADRAQIQSLIEKLRTPN